MPPSRFRAHLRRLLDSASDAAKDAALHSAMDRMGTDEGSDSVPPLPFPLLFTWVQIRDRLGRITEWRRVAEPLPEEVRGADDVREKDGTDKSATLGRRFRLRGETPFRSYVEVPTA